MLRPTCTNILEALTEKQAMGKSARGLIRSSQSTSSLQVEKSVSAEAGVGTVNCVGENNDVVGLVRVNSCV
jgi:hypothetical protein